MDKSSKDKTFKNIEKLTIENIEKNKIKYKKMLYLSLTQLNYIDVSCEDFVRDDMLELWNNCKFKKPDSKTIQDIYAKCCWKIDNYFDNILNTNLNYIKQMEHSIDFREAQITISEKKNTNKGILATNITGASFDIKAQYNNNVNDLLNDLINLDNTIRKERFKQLEKMLEDKDVYNTMLEYRELSLFDIGKFSSYKMFAKDYDVKKKKVDNKTTLIIIKDKNMEG